MTISQQSFAASNFHLFKVFGAWALAFRPYQDHFRHVFIVQRLMPLGTNVSTKGDKCASMSSSDRRSLVGTVCNVSLTDEQWLQASPHVRNGCLGLRRVSSLNASSAFLASAAGTRLLQEQDQIRSSRIGTAGEAALDKCRASRHRQEMPEERAAGSHRE